MTSSIVSGLDIGTSSIRLVVCEKNPARPDQGTWSSQPAAAGRVLAQVKKPSRGLRRGYIVNFEETRAALNDVVREAERQAKTKIKRVILGIGGVGLESKTAEGGIAVSTADLAVSSADITRAVEASEANLSGLNNRRILHTIPLSFKLDGKKILGQPADMIGSKLEVKTLFIHCLEQHVADFIRAAAAARLEVDEVMAAPLAGSLPVLSTAQKTAGVLLANIGSETTSLAVFEEGLAVSLQVLPLGSADVTNDIALGLRLPLDEAERLKLDPAQALNIKKKLDEIIEARWSDLFELIELHLKKIGRNGLLPAGVVLIGGGAAADNLAKLARAALRLPAQTFESNQGYLKNQLSDSSWLVAHGLALSGLGLEAEEGLGLQKMVRATGAGFWRWLKELWP